LKECGKEWPNLRHYPGFSLGEIEENLEKPCFK
jgi:hypothetical protein